MKSISKDVDTMARDLINVKMHNKAILDTLERNLEFISQSLKFQDQRIADRSAAVGQELHKERNQNQLVELFSDAQRTFMLGVA